MRSLLLLLLFSVHCKALDFTLCTGVTVYTSASVWGFESYTAYLVCASMDFPFKCVHVVVDLRKDY